MTTSERSRTRVTIEGGVEGTALPRLLFLLSAAGIVLGILTSVAFWPLVRPEPHEAVLALTLAVFALNAATFAVHALAPIVHRLPGGRRLIESVGRVYILADLQATVVTLALLWLTLLFHM